MSLLFTGDDHDDTAMVSKFTIIIGIIVATLYLIWPYIT